MPPSSRSWGGGTCVSPTTTRAVIAVSRIPVENGLLRSWPEFHDPRPSPAARAHVQRSVSPASQVCSLWRRVPNALHNLRQIHLIVVQARVPVRLRRIAIPAVLGARPVANLPVVGNAVSGGAGQLQEVFHQVNRIVQEIG